MYQRLELCPSCGSNDFQNSIITKDHLVSGESFAIAKCLKCSLLFTNPRPSEDQLPEFYKSENYISHSSSSPGFTGILYRFVRWYTIRKKLQLIESYSKRTSLLDYGSGVGTFLKYAGAKGWKITGLEPDKEARNIATGNNLNTVYSDINEIIGKKFDVITLWHSLEHVYNLRHTLNILNAALSDGGKLIIAVPNHKSLDSQLYKEFWAGYDVPRHLYHFSKVSMKKLIENYNLELLDIYPMKFDSYYVSLLSENYSGNKNIANAFVNGWKSNSWAHKNDAEYSSLIYVFSK